MRYRIRTTRLLACTAIGVSTLGLATGLTAGAAELLQPPSIDDMAVYAAGVSADGSVVVGTLNPGQSWTRSGFMWTQAGGMQRVGGVSAGSMLEKRFTATGVSNDGTVIVGQASPDMFPAGPFTARAYWWTAVDGFVDLGGLPDALPTSNANGVSGDGRVVVGEAPNAAGAARGFRWTREGGMVDLGDLPGMVTLGAVAASYDGSVIVGNAAGGYGLGAQGFRWTANGIELLAKLNGGYPSEIATQSFVRDISDDGRVIVGQASNGTTGRSSATRWVDGVAEDLHTPGSGLGDNYSFAYGVSGNGAVVVGQASLNDAVGQLGSSNKTERGFRWTEEDGMQSVEEWLEDSGATIVTDITYVARAANCDGSVVVGETGPATGPNQMFIARGKGNGPTTCDGATSGEDTGGGDAGGGDTGGEDTGSEDTGGGDTGNGDTGGEDTGGEDTGGGDTGGEDTGGEDTGGGDTGGGDTGGEDTGGGDTGGGDTGGEDTGGEDTGGGDTSGDDTGGEDTGGGDTAGGDTGGGDTGGVGLIIVDEFNASLADAGAANVALLGNVNLLLNGAGSRPLDRRADPGKTIAWIGGDWGRIDVGGNDGGIGVGEIGIGRNLGGVQINAVAGFTRFDQALALGGSAELSAGYVKVEALSQLYATDNGGLWAALTASGMWGKADFSRNYMNGGIIDTSVGSTDASGYGIRGRLQWENAIQYVSPYADLSYSRGCLDAYSETGGGFPAAFDKLCDASTELRYGFDVTYPATDAFRLIGTLEGVHRFEDKSANVTGQAIGLYAFDLGGMTYQQDWLRAGAGFEADIGASTISVMGNATTQSNGPNAWIAANWRVTF